MDPSTITTVEELPEPLREELVAKRKAGTTLAELKKQNPHVASDVIRAVLPPLPKGTEPKPGPRKPRVTQPAQSPTTGQRKDKPSAKAQPTPASNGGTTDKERLALARKVERFNRTLLTEWAYVRLYTTNSERTAALDDWLHLYNHHRAHTALGGHPPISRVNNPPNSYS